MMFVFHSINHNLSMHDGITIGKVYKSIYNSEYKDYRWYDNNNASRSCPFRDQFGRTHYKRYVTEISLDHYIKQIEQL